MLLSTIPQLPEETKEDEDEKSSIEEITAKEFKDYFS